MIIVHAVILLKLCESGKHHELLSVQMGGPSSVASSQPSRQHGPCQLGTADMYGCSFKEFHPCDKMFSEHFSEMVLLKKVQGSLVEEPELKLDFS